MNLFGFIVLFILNSFFISFAQASCSNSYVDRLKKSFFDEHDDFFGSFESEIRSKGIFFQELHKDSSDPSKKGTFIQVKPLRTQEGDLASLQQLKGKHWLTVLATQVEKLDPDAKIGFMPYDQNSFAKYIPNLKWLILPLQALHFPKIPPSSVHEWLHFMKDQDILTSQKLLDRVREGRSWDSIFRNFPNYSRPLSAHYFTKSIRKKIRRSKLDVFSTFYLQHRVHEEGYNRVIEVQMAIKQAEQILKVIPSSNDIQLKNALHDALQLAEKKALEASDIIKCNLEDLQQARDFRNLRVISNQDGLHYLLLEYGDGDQMIFSIPEIQVYLRTLESPLQNQDLLRKVLNNQIEYEIQLQKKLEALKQKALQLKLRVE